MALTLAGLGARVVATDLAPNLSLLRGNVETNGFSDQIEVVEHVWGTDASALGDPFDAVFACDTMYVAEAVPALVETLRAVSRLDSLVVVAYGRNRQAEDLFLARAKPAFHLAIVSSRQLHPDFQTSDVAVMRLRPRKKLRTGHLAKPVMPGCAKGLSDEATADAKAHASTDADSDASRGGAVAKAAAGVLDGTGANHGKGTNSIDGRHGEEDTTIDASRATTSTPLDTLGANPPPPPSSLAGHHRLHSSARPLANPMPHAHDASRRAAPSCRRDAAPGRLLSTLEAQQRAAECPGSLDEAANDETSSGGSDVSAEGHDAEPRARATGPQPPNSSVPPPPLSPPVSQRVAPPRSDGGETVAEETPCRRKGDEAAAPHAPAPMASGSGSALQKRSIDAAGHGLGRKSARLESTA